LYTQCAKCETVFRLSAEVLRAAGGQVRCGRCGEVFNALARLAEDASTFPAGESALELEARADEILQSTVPAVSPTAPAAEDSEDFGAADVEFARLQVLDMLDDDAKDAPEKPEPAPPPRRDDSAKAVEAAKAAAALKLAAAARAAAGLKAAASKTPPAGAKSGDAVKPGDLAKPGAGGRSASPAKPGDVAKPADATKLGGAAKSAGAAGSADARRPTPPPPAAPASADEQEHGSLEFTLPPGELDRIFVEAAPRPAESAAPAAPGQGTEPIRGEGARGRVAGLEVPEIEARAHRPLPFALWLGAALALALLLGAQMTHENRGWLATHAPLRGALHGLYAALGVAPPAAATLSSYQLRQWGVTGDPSASGTLRVRASILNTSPQLQPYPLLRVALANRFGARIGTRDFEPAEYMGKPVVRMLAPGERADATLDIVDPGKDAEGFEIDVCLRNIEQKISCAGDAAARPSAAQPKQ
jgi:predicted Zn finger-like uncharacterized protein